MEEAFDLLLVGGSLLHPTSGQLVRRDIGFKDGKVQRIARNLAQSKAGQVYATEEGIFVPGLVDVHAHVFDGIGDSVDPDDVCLSRGTTTVVDGGSAGANSFNAFEMISGQKQVDVLAWLNLSTIGQVDTRVGELLAIPHVDVAKAIHTIDKHRDLIVGLKARLSTYVLGGTSLPVLRLLREAADAVGLPIMVHIGDTAEGLDEILPYLGTGDVVTHMMTNRKNGILDWTGTVRKSVWEARERGVLFDASRGLNHESFDVVEACLAQGFLPDTISTDLTQDTARNADYGLVLLASQYMHFGLGLRDVISRMTSAAGHLLGREALGRLEEGGFGDCTVLRQVPGEMTFQDVNGRVEHGNRYLVVEAVIKNGTLVSPGPSER